MMEEKTFLFFVVEDSMLNNIRECGVSKQHSVKVRNFPGTTTERINEEIDDTHQANPDLIITHASTNDIATKINPLNNLIKVLKKCNELSSKTKLAVSNVIVRKDKVNLEKGCKNLNSRMKNFCQQKGIDIQTIVTLQKIILVCKSCTWTVREPLHLLRI